MSKHTIFFKNKPKIIATATICGPKESEGNLGGYIDKKLPDDYDKEKTFEHAERKMLTYVIRRAIEKGGKKISDIDAIIAGDLLNQIISSSFAAREFDTSYLGVYNACSTLTEALIIGSSLVDGGYLNNVVCATGSHFATAERQYRFPVEQGTTRPAQSQWTVTGSGADLISREGKGITVLSARLGKVIDYGISDANNMGAAMAPAAADTLLGFFNDTGASSCDYDMILTGDLGALGSRILKDLVKMRGLNIDDNHLDCGELIYNIDEKEYQGGSGAGCAAVVFNSYIYKKMLLGDFKRILFLATGALLSTTSTQQGDTIPGVAHLVELCSCVNKN